MFRMSSIDPPYAREMYGSGKKNRNAEGHVRDSSKPMQFMLGDKDADSQKQVHFL